jgi:hypothetical protein
VKEIANRKSGILGEYIQKKLDNPERAPKLSKY